MSAGGETPRINLQREMKEEFLRARERSAGLVFSGDGIFTGDPGPQPELEPGTHLYALCGCSRRRCDGTITYRPCRAHGWPDARETARRLFSLDSHGRTWDPFLMRGAALKIPYPSIQRPELFEVPEDDRVVIVFRKVDANRLRYRFLWELASRAMVPLRVILTSTGVRECPGNVARRAHNAAVKKGGCRIPDCPHISGDWPHWVVAPK